jgi:AmmeMemoRadiSam system protein B
VLQSRGFLETEEFSQLQETRHAEFRAAAERSPTHAGSAYPDDAQLLKDTFDSFFDRSESAAGTGRLVGVAAPHVSPEGGRDCYAAAYDRLDSSLVEKTFVILGTSHYGGPDTLGLTRKSFTTPLGRAEVDQESVGFLLDKAPDVVAMEDYCHAVEHSIEFQVVFLQHRLGAPVRIIPILCGPFVGNLEDGGLGAFFNALAELAVERKEDLFWILGIDLSHIGKRYGDPFSASAYEGPMAAVQTEDKKRLDRVCEADFTGLKELVQPEVDHLKWCGFSPLYTFLASAGREQDIQGRVLKYQQWNIDPESVVSFAGIEFVYAE